MSAAFSPDDLYVSPLGQDHWTGRLAEPNAEGTDGPVATLSKARDLVRELRHSARCLGPLTVWLRGGVYRLTEPVRFGPADSGPTTYAAYPGEEPIFDGGEAVAGWEETTVNGCRAWVADVSEWLAEGGYFRSLFVNDRRRPRARLPKGGFFWMEEAPHVPGGQLFEGADRFRVNPADFKPWRNLTDVDVIVMHYWVEERMPVTAYDPASGWCQSSHRSIFVLKDDVHNRPAKYYVENVFEALSEPGEWYLDREAGKLYYLPLADETPENTKVIAPRALQLLRVSGDLEAGRPVTGLHFRGLTFRHTDWTPVGGFGKWYDPCLPPEQWRVRDSYRHFVNHNGADPHQEYAAMPQAAFHVPGVIVLAGAENCAIEDCTVAHVGWYGIELAEACRSNRLVGNTLTDLGAGGIKLDGADAEGRPELRTGLNRLTDNHLSDGGHAFLSACGVALIHSFGNTVSHNHIHDFYYTGISCGWVWGYAENVSRDNLIEKNHIHDLGKGILSDMGGIYTLGVQPGTVLRGNVIHDIEKSNYGGWAIYPDEGSSHILIENNLCYNTSSTVFHQHYGRENVVRNNIWACGREGTVQLSRAGSHRGFTFERNIVLSDGQPLYVGGYSHRFAQRNTITDLNLLWDVAGEPWHKEAEERYTVAQLRELGIDQHSVVADPGFADLQNSDFTLAEDSPALALGFEPFDISDVGPRPSEARD
jgi:hypothetical protein